MKEWRSDEHLRKEQSGCSEYRQHRLFCKAPSLIGTNCSANLLSCKASSASLLWCWLPPIIQLQQQWGGYKECRAENLANSFLFALSLCLLFRLANEDSDYSCVCWEMTSWSCGGGNFGEGTELQLLLLLIGALQHAGNRKNIRAKSVWVCKFVHVGQVSRSDFLLLLLLPLSKSFDFLREDFVTLFLTWWESQLQIVCQFCQIFA